VVSTKILTKIRFREKEERAPEKKSVVAISSVIVKFSGVLSRILLPEEVELTIPRAVTEIC
jgi:hypothetical protein